MRGRTVLLALAIVLVAGCRPTGAPSSPPDATPDGATPPGATPGATPAVTPAAGIEALVADLVAGGVQAKVGSQFLAEPLGGQGTSVCIGTETVQVYEFIDHEAALAASAKIDRNNPSNVGTAIVHWNGQPRFWLRDRIIVLYLGPDAAIDAALRGLLGPPFAESREPGPGLLPNPPCQ